MLKSNALKLLPATVLPLACAGCLAFPDPWATLTDDSQDLEGTFELQYVLMTPFGPGFAYQTGSQLAQLDPNGSSQSIADTRAAASNPTVHVAGDGPGYRIEPLVEEVAKGVEAGARWFPDTFADGFRVTLHLENHEAIDFRRTFIASRSPWPMAFATHGDRVDTAAERVAFASTISHEAYHLANSVSRTGLALPEFEARPDAGWIYEETAANLIGACVRIELGQAVGLDRAAALTIDLIDERTGDRQTVSPPLPPSVTARVIDAMAATHEPNEHPRLLWAWSFYQTVFHHYANGADRIAPNTLEAERLIAACDRVGPDVTQVEAILRSLGSS
ncbi:hypothetical protein ACWCOP_05640 [Maricaulaceae bacterium MS644]